LWLAYSVFSDALSVYIHTRSLHDALPISVGLAVAVGQQRAHSQDDERQDADDRADVIVLFVDGQLVQPGDQQVGAAGRGSQVGEDRKSTRLNSSHVSISYAVFCLKTKNTT